MSFGTIANKLLDNINNGGNIVNSGLLDTVNSIYNNTAYAFASHLFIGVESFVLPISYPYSFFSVLAICKPSLFPYTISLQVGNSTAGVASNYITVNQTNNGVMVNHSDAIPMPSNYFVLNCTAFGGVPGSGVDVYVGFRP
jgi:hypothetical protein